MANSFLDSNEFGATQSAAAPEAPTVGGLPQLGGYSTGIKLKSPEGILPNLLAGSFNIPPLNIDVDSLIKDAENTIEDFKLPDADEIEEKAEEDGLDPVEWVDENIVKPIDQNIIRPIDQNIEDYIVDPVVEDIIKPAIKAVDQKVVRPIDQAVEDYIVDPIVEDVVKPTGELVGDFISKIDDEYIDPFFSKFTTPKFIKDLENAGGEFLDIATDINDFIKNPNSASSAKFLNSIDRLYGMVTKKGAAQITLPEFELIEGAGVTGGQTLEGSRLFDSGTINAVQNTAALYNIGSYIQNPTVEGTASVYGDVLHLTKDIPEVYEVLGGDTAADFVANVGNYVSVYNAIEAAKGGVEGVDEALSIASGFASGAQIAGLSGVGSLAGPLALGALAIMIATNDQDFPRAFASIEYNPDAAYAKWSGAYPTLSAEGGSSITEGYFDPGRIEKEYVTYDTSDSIYNYALDEYTNTNFGGYGPFIFGDGRQIDGGSGYKPNTAIRTAQEFANWMVTGLGYEVDEEAFKKFAEDGSNFVGDGDIGYIQAKHGLKGIKNTAYEVVSGMIDAGVFKSTDATVVLDPEDWKQSMSYLIEASDDPSIFLYKKLADISDPITGDTREQINSVKNEIESSAKAYAESVNLAETNPEKYAEGVKNSLIDGVFNAEGSLTDKISAVEKILAADTQTVIDNTFNAPVEMAKTFYKENLGIPDDPYTRFQESQQFIYGPSPFGFYGTLPYIG